MSASISLSWLIGGTALAIGCLRASDADPFADLDAAASARPQAVSASDPFADLDALLAPNPLLPPPGSVPDPAAGAAMAGAADPFGDLDAAASGKPPPGSSSDPFGDLDTPGAPHPLSPGMSPDSPPHQPWGARSRTTRRLRFSA